MSNQTSTSAKGLFESISRLGSTLLSIVHTRLELISVDIEEDRVRMLKLVAMSLVTLLSLLIGIVLLIITLIVAFWDNYRILVLASLAGTFLVLATITWVLAIRQAKAKPKMFITSLLELVKDREQLDAN